MKDLLDQIGSLSKKPKQLKRPKTFTDEELEFLLDTRNSYAKVVAALACGRKTILKLRREHGVIQ